MNPYYEYFKKSASESQVNKGEKYNPYYEYFKEISGNGFSPDEAMGNIYKGTLRQMGYGYHDFDSMRGDGWLSDIFNNVAKPLLIQGAKYLGLKGVDMASNIATDAIKGKNLVDSTKERFQETKDSVLEEVPKAIFGVFKKNNKAMPPKRKAISRPSAGTLVTSGSKRRKITGKGFTNNQFHRKLTDHFPVLQYL